MNRPHSREKRIVDKKVKVTKKPIDKTETKTGNIIFDILRKVIKK